MEISKSTPYVRYRENISSTLHKGTIHIESKYLDRERKTTIESIEGQTWQNMVNGENKEEDILPRLGLKIEGNEDVLDSKEQHMPIDTIIGYTEPVANEDGTYTYEVSTMEGSYAQTYDGVNNIVSSSDGLEAQMSIIYATNEDNISNSISMNNGESSYNIVDSYNGEIKSAILSGNTLVNLVGEKREYVTQPSKTLYGWEFMLPYNLTSGKTYLAIFDVSGTIDESNSKVYLMDNGFNSTSGNTSSNVPTFSLGQNVVKCIATNDMHKVLRIRTTYNENEKFTVSNVMLIEYQEGMENWDIPYFEGMQSVKMPVLTTVGKNLFNGTFIDAFVASGNDYTVSFDTNVTSILVNVNKNTDYILSAKTTFDRSQIGGSLVPIKIGTKTTRIENSRIGNTIKFNSGEFTHLIFYLNSSKINIEDIQVEEGSTATSYEPYKTNILTVNEEVELRGIGDVSDTLDCLTGELTQRIGEIVLDGSENWELSTTKENTQVFYYNSKASIKDYNAAICDKFRFNVAEDDVEKIVMDKMGQIYIAVEKTKSDSVSKFKTWLSNNNIFIQYQLATESIKTVVLTTKDQDGKLVHKLSTYPTITHVNLSSDGLIPSADISYTLLKSTGEASGISIQFTNGKASDLISGIVYGESLVNALPSPSLKNSMDYNISMQKINNGYDNINVADGEFKKATLYGQTLVNLAPKVEDTVISNYQSGDIVLTPEITPLSSLKASTKYTVIFKASNVTNATEGMLQYQGASVDNVFIKENIGNYTLVNGCNKLTFTAIGGISRIQLISYSTLSTGGSCKIHGDSIMILEGDYTNQNIPYFEGIQSVKIPSLMTSNQRFTILPYEIFENSTPINYQGFTRIDFGLTLTDVMCYIKLNNDTKIKMIIDGFEEVNTNSGISKGVEYSKKLNSVSYIGFYSWDDTQIKFGNGKEIILSMLKNGELEIIFSKDGENMYPHYSSQTKTNTLTTPEDVTLRAVGSVRDELDCVTGELTQRIGEVVLDGSENWNASGNNANLSNINYIQFYWKNSSSILKNKRSMFMCDKITVKPFDNWINNWNDMSLAESFVILTNNNEIGIRIPCSYLNEQNENGFKQWLSQNPITVQYELATPTTKTVSTSIVDQDGTTQPKLQSYTNGYITSSSQGLIPSVNYEVPTNNSYYLDLVKPNTQYTTKSSLDCNATIDGTSYPLSANGTFTTPSTITDKLMVLDTPITDLMFIEGDLTGRNIDYFTGICSVENPMIYTLPNNIDDVNFMGMIEWNGDSSYIYKLPIKGQHIWYKVLGSMWNSVSYYDKDMNFIGSETNQGMSGSYTTVTILSNDKIAKAVYFKINKKTPNNGAISQLRTTYSKPDIPYTDIKQLSTTPQITLNGIGDVKDEWDVVNETVTRRIGLREYQDGDLTNNNVITDMTNTVYQLPTPTTEPVRITPQNPQESTTSITLDTALQKVGNVTDQLRWNPYKGHYVRYNYIQDGVASDTYTIQNLTSLNERKFVNLYNQRTYIDTDHNIESRSYGISIPTIAEQGKQYQVRWDYVEAPSVDTIKIDLCGNVKEIPSSDNSVVIDVDKYTHSFVQIQAEGLTGKITNVMVIETVQGEIPDVDFFSGMQCVGNVVQVDGVNKAEIVVEQTNGNLIDVDFKITTNGDVIETSYLSLKANKDYYATTPIIYKNGTRRIKIYDDNGNNRNVFLNAAVATFTTSYNEHRCMIYKQCTNNGSTNIHEKFELCYADMAKDGIRPRYYDKESFILPQKLCRVGEVYDNLYYDDLKGYYRIQQSIGHKYFMGESSELWNMETTEGYRTIKFTCTNANIDMRAMGATICNGWKHLANINTDTEGFIIYNGTFVIRVDNERLSASTIVAFKEYLASSPIHLFYQLKTPTMVDLTQYPKRIELNTYRDEIFTFLKGLNPTRFTLSVPFDKTYRFDDRQEGQGYAKRVTITDERISPENVVAIQEVRGQGIANIIEDANNVPVTPQPNYSGKATSHTLNNTKPATINTHGFEPSGDTKVGTYNTTDKAYQIKVMSSNADNSLSDYYVLNLPYQLETYADGTKDKVYYNEAYKEWHFMGGTTKSIGFTSGTGVFTEPFEVFRGLAPRTGMIAEFKLRFDGTSNSSRFYYSLDGVSYTYGTIRNVAQDVDIYVAFFNTGGIKLDYAYKVGADSTYDNIVPIANYIPECLYINQIQTLTSCEVTIDKQYIYSELKAPISLETYDGTTKVYMDGNTTDTNIIMNNDCLKKVVNTYPDVEYTVYWKYLSGDGKLTVTLGGTKVEVDGIQEYATVRTQSSGSQELLYVGGYNLSIQDLMVVKGAKINELAYFEGSREVGTLVLDEHGNKSYKITLVQGGSVLGQRDNDTIAFKDDNKHNVVVHKIVGVCPTKVD